MDYSKVSAAEMSTYTILLRMILILLVENQKLRTQNKCLRGHAIIQRTYHAAF